MRLMSLPPLATGRRLELLEAATAVVADGGLRALTHRAVDAQAGVPEGSTSGYFRTRLALLTGLTEQVARQLADMISALRDRVEAISREHSGAERDDLVGAEVARHLVALTADSSLVRVQAELGIEAMRTPALAAVFDVSRSEFVRLVVDIAQEVFVRLMKNASAYDPSKGSFRAWLVVMIRNAHHNFVAKAKNRSLATGGSNVPAALTEEPARQDLVEKILEAYDIELFQMAVNIVRSEVDEKKWLCFHMSLVCVVDDEALAAELNLASKNVVQQFRKQVKDRLREQVRLLQQKQNEKFQ